MMVKTSTVLCPQSDTDETKGRQMVRHQRNPLVLVGSIPTPKFFDEYILKNFEGGFAHK
ncbi:hypothetical protein ACNR9V_17300 [Parageobacillus thermoglucosidasius]|uniref:hypothetical protein n=1 Tax=Parageobacillus thermoglucosidasius TaxID=1426 RepID=UPI003B66DBF5